MMGSLFEHTHNLFKKTLFLSLLAHLIIFNLFLFNFPIQRIEPRPQFIFLGSLLRGNDIKINLNTAREPNAFWGRLPISLEETKKTLVKTPVEKPPTLNIIDTPKKTIKSSFLTSVTKEKKPKTSSSEIGVETEITPYEPLRFSLP